MRLRISFGLLILKWGNLMKRMQRSTYCILIEIEFFGKTGHAVQMLVLSIQYKLTVVHDTLLRLLVNKDV